MNLNNKRVLIREDLNVPMKDGVITDDARIRRALPTIQNALTQNAAVIVLSHLGRPIEGIFEEKYSLKPVAKKLGELLHRNVLFAENWIDGVSIQPGQVMLCENVRFLKGEKACDELLSKKMAALCDVFIMDAFATAHRAHASTVGIVKYAPVSIAGPLLEAELKALSHVLKHPKRPLVAIVGGAKVSTKMQVLDHLLDKVNTLIVGGGIANTFLAAAGFSVGKSLYEKDWVETAGQLLQKAKSKNISVPLPMDVAVAKRFSADESAIIKTVDQVTEDDMILDVGPKTAASYGAIMQAAKTIVWNGPVGVFEFSAFAAGTKVLAEAIANSSAYSVAGGGDTISAIAQYHIEDKIDYISTGGGAFLEWLEGRELPGVSALNVRS